MTLPRLEIRRVRERVVGLNPRQWKRMDNMEAVKAEVESGREESTKI
jgi:hypothetical protein